MKWEIDMGAWGAGIFEDDLAEDIRSFYEDEKQVWAPIEVGKKVLNRFKAESKDSDEMPVLYLALFSLLWDDGVQLESVTERSEEIVKNGLGLERWEEQGPEVLEERKAVYKSVADKLMTKNSNSGPLAKRKKAIFGDYFIISLADGRFAYGQYLHKCTHYGQMVQIFADITNSPIDIQDVDITKMLFPPVFSGLDGAIRDGSWKIIGHADIQNFKYPLFRSGTADLKGKIHYWWIWDGTENKEIGGNLPAKYRNLERKIIWGSEILEERIEKGYLPILDVD